MRKLTVQEAVAEGWFKPNERDGYCHCGCGSLTPKASTSNRRRGHIRGEHLRFCNSGHSLNDPTIRAKSIAAHVAGLAHPQWNGGHARKGNEHPLYRVWRSMQDRCYNPKNARYADWGGRGIRVCERWRADFRNFLADMGERPPGRSIDRIDNDGDYEPGNCRWATASEQVQNRRVLPKTEDHYSVKLTAADARSVRFRAALGTRTQTLADEYGVSFQAMWKCLTRRTWGHVF